MKNLLTFLFCLLSVSAFGQGLKLNFMTTNQTMVTLPSEGFVPIWNDTAKRWSNGVQSASVTNAQPPSQILTNLAQTGAITNVNEGNRLYVRTNGINATAARGRIDKPWAHITNAFANAVAGDWIDVDSGHYYIPTNTTSLARTGVKWMFRDTVVSSGNLVNTDSEWLFDDQGGAVTNFAVYGSGTFMMTNQEGSVLYFTNAQSDVFFECKKILTLGQQGAIFHEGGSLTAYISEELQAVGYDAYLNNGQTPGRVYLKCPRVIGGNSSIEVGYAFQKFGDAVFDVGYAEGSFNLVDNMIANIGAINLESVHYLYSGASNIYSGFSQGSGTLQNCIVYGDDSRTIPLIDLPNPIYRTDGTFKNVRFYGPTNSPAILVNSESVMTFENCRIIDGWAATNSLIATNPQSITVIGTLTAPAGWTTNITFRAGTNVMVGFHNIGKGTNSGDLLVGGTIFAYNGLQSFSDINLTSGDLYANANVLASNLFAAIQFSLPNSASPATTAVGDVAFDDNAWAAGRGAVQVFDGTANTYLVGVLASDTPSNGQMLQWNTGGTITWVDPPAGGSVGPGSLAFNLDQFDTNSNVSIKSGALVTNLSARNLTIPTATANRVAQFNGSSDLTNHPDMRLAASLSGAADGEVLKYDGASGTWTNAADSGTTTPGGAVGNIQVKMGSSFVGFTNSLVDVTNGTMIIGLGSESRRPESVLQITNSTGGGAATIFVDNESSSALKRMGIRPGSIGTESTTATANTNWNLVAGGSIKAQVTSHGLFVGGVGNASGVVLGAHNAFVNTNLLVSNRLDVLGATVSHWITNTLLISPSVRPAGAGGLVHLNGATNNWFISATTNELLVLTNLSPGSTYYLAVSNGANVVVTMSNAAAIKVANMPSGQFPSFNTNGFTYMTFRIDDISGSTNLVAYSSTELSLVTGWKLGMGTNASAQTVTLNVTNAQTLIASNATSVQVDFSAGTPDYYSTDVMRANLSVQPTNLVVGRTATIYLTGDTNANERTVTVITNGIAGGAAIRWFFNTPTNGATSFTVTNTQRAELSLKVLSATEIWAAWSPVR